MKTIPNEQLCSIVEKNNRSGGYRDISDKIRLTVQYIQCKVFTRCFAQKNSFREGLYKNPLVHRSLFTKRRPCWRHGERIEQ